MNKQYLQPIMLVCYITDDIVRTSETDGLITDLEWTFQQGRFEQ